LGATFPPSRRAKAPLWRDGGQSPETELESSATSRQECLLYNGFRALMGDVSPG
jgi:hypothetical protein